MALRTVGEFKESIAGILTGTDLDDVTNLNIALERAARTLVQRAKMPEATARLAFNLYNGVIDYPSDQAMFGTQIIDMRPQGISRVPTDFPYKDTLVRFDRTKRYSPNGHTLTFEYNNGVPIMRAVSPYPTQRIIIDPMSTTTGWAVGGNASALAVDSTAFYQSPAALRFNLGVSSSQGYIEKTLTTAIDLTAYQGVGVGFLAVELPSATHITSIGMRLGSSNANYYDVSNTQGFLGAWIAGKYLLIAFDLALATTIGTPIITKMSYVRVYVNTDSTVMPNMRVGGLWISLPSPTEIIYQTAGFFISSATGLLSQKITTDNDFITLNDAGYLLYEHEGAMAVVMQAGGTLASGIGASLSGKLNGARTRTGAVIELGLYDLYRADNPSQALESYDNYYYDGSGEPLGR